MKTTNITDNNYTFQCFLLRRNKICMLWFDWYWSLRNLHLEIWNIFHNICFCKYCNTIENFQTASQYFFQMRNHLQFNFILNISCKHILINITYAIYRSFIKDKLLRIIEPYTLPHLQRKSCTAEIFYRDQPVALNCRPQLVKT